MSDKMIIYTAEIFYHGKAKFAGYKHIAKNFNNAMGKKIKVEMIILSDIGYSCSKIRNITK
ncbi:MAG: hypothetical protein AB7S81_06235, partial [Bdellovibrionales bacterium]